MTERAWMVVRQARDEARRLGDEYIGTDHLLLAMLRDGGGAGATLLEDCGITYDEVYARMAGEPSVVPA